MCFYRRVLGEKEKDFTIQKERNCRAAFEGARHSGRICRIDKIPWTKEVNECLKARVVSSYEVPGGSTLKRERLAHMAIDENWTDTLTKVGR